MDEFSDVWVDPQHIENILQESLEELYQKDLVLLQNDVSERSITHKLAEYLQRRIPELNVDCEYNRNIELGANASKTLYVLTQERAKRVRHDIFVNEDDLLAVSTFPDIIVHRRATNAQNFLVVEVKKAKSKVGCEFDYKKLKAFTEVNEQNSYGYRFGVFILLVTGVLEPPVPCLRWFSDGVALD